MAEEATLEEKTRNGGEDYGYNEEADRSGGREIGVRSRRLNVTAEKAPFDLSYRPSRVLLYSPPRQRQKWGDAHVLPRVNWGDIFFDLFYVGATYNVSNIIVDSPNKEGLLYAAGTFLPIMGIWSQKTHYDARYVTEADVYHRFLSVFYFVVLAVAISHIRPVQTLANASGETSMFVFSLMLVVDRLFALTLYAEVYFKGVGQRSIKQASFRDALCHSVCLPFYVAALIIAAVEFFGDGTAGDRRLAGTVEVTTTETTNIPIYLCLLGYVGGLIAYGLYVIFGLPGGGRHKEV